jgi:hypothetical protein
MQKISASICLFGVILAAAQAHAARTFSVEFTISNTEGFNGVDAASLAENKGNLSGTVTVITPDGTFPCSVNFGSTDIHDQLSLTCTIGPAEMVTLSGRLNLRTGKGKGTFSETFFKEQGTYKATQAN